ncbi:unnamed protein product, partial [Mesorhabditis spiculigera]
MNRALSSCFSASLQVCPLTAIFFRRTNAQQQQPTPDDSYEPVKKPTIVINSLDSSHYLPGPYFEENKENARRLSNGSNRSPGDHYAARVNFTTQYITAKKTLIIKIRDCSENDIECFDSDSLSQIRVLVPCAKGPKQQTAYAGGFHPTFDECLLFTNIEENDMLAGKLRFRLYVKRGKNRPELLGEAELKGKLVNFDSPPQMHGLKLGGPPKMEDEECGGSFTQSQDTDKFKEFRW